MVWKRWLVSGLLALGAIWPRPAFAQQRPLVTEDPETVGAGLILLEGGVDFARDVEYPASGLTGNLWRVPRLGISLGLSSIAELQIDGGFRDRLDLTGQVDAPLSDLLKIDERRTSSIQDMVVATKIRLAGETAGRPAFGVRLATKLPLASVEDGLGLGTTDFYVSALVGKTVQSIRVVGNIGAGILGDPTEGSNHNNVLVYGVSVARAVAVGMEIVGEVSGRTGTGSGEPPPGTESRAIIRVGARYTRGAGRVDAGFLVGMTALDPSIGFTVGFTYVFNAFRVP